MNKQINVLTNPSNVTFRLGVADGDNDKYIFESNVFHDVYVKALQYEMETSQLPANWIGIDENGNKYRIGDDEDGNEYNMMADVSEKSDCYRAWEECMDTGGTVISDDEIWIELVKPD